MSIKERIGQRIKDERMSRGLTRKALAALTEKLSISRINNYERGERTPGPEEIKDLATALEVAPAYLMCLSDNKEGKLANNSGIGAQVPILDYQQACFPSKSLENLKNESNDDKYDFIPVSSNIIAKSSQNTFALIIKDTSMSPELRPNDIVLVSEQPKINPGDFLVAKLEGSNEVIIRKFKQLSTTKKLNEYQLSPLNEDWADTHVNSDNKCEIIGVVVQLVRDLSKLS